MGRTIEPTKTAPRVRLTADVDLTTAKQHNRCNGTGIVGYQKIDDPNSPGGQQSVPVVCRCVSRRGGVKRDLLDRMSGEMQQQLHDGTFAQQLASDVQRLPSELKALKVTELRARVVEKDIDPMLKKQINQVLANLQEA